MPTIIDRATSIIWEAIPATCFNQLNVPLFSTRQSNHPNLRSEMSIKYPIIRHEFTMNTPSIHHEFTRNSP